MFLGSQQLPFLDTTIASTLHRKSSPACSCIRNGFSCLFIIAHAQLAMPDFIPTPSLSGSLLNSETSLARIQTTIIISYARPGTTAIGSSGGISQSALPLTTLFTPPSDCRASSAYWQPGNATSINSTTTCYPQSWESYQKTANGFYSPGVCPLSYEWPTVSVVPAPDGIPVTQAVCCPQ